jgi:hypothetical protein
VINIVCNLFFNLSNVSLKPSGAASKKCNGISTAYPMTPQQELAAAQ